MQLDVGTCQINCDNKRHPYETLIRNYTLKKWETQVMLLTLTFERGFSQK
jgi:hypothetical protein